MAHPEDTLHPDLSSIPVLTDYLSDTPFAVTKIEPLSGGYTNFVFRLHLKTPYEGRETLALKHAKSFITVNGEKFPLDIGRHRNEANALRLVHSFLPPDSFVTVPKVHYYDPIQHVLIMDDAGPTAVTLKQYCTDFTPSNAGTRASGVYRVCTELGKFIRAFHTRLRGDEAAMTELGAYEQAKSIYAQATYGRLVSTLKLTDSETLELLGTESLGVSEADLGVIEGVEQETSAAIMGAHGTIVHGDFWTGNILLTLSPQLTTTHLITSVHIVDWEIARHGIPALDLGQFCAEMELLIRFRPQCSAAASAGVKAFVDAYRGCGLESGEEEEMRRRLVVHVGAHFLTWPPRTGEWGGRQEMRDLAKVGARLLVHGSQADSDTAKRLQLS